MSSIRHDVVLSLGAGVQSTVLALLLDHSRIGLRKRGYSRPNYAVFADTGWEPSYVYEHLAWLEKQVSYPVYVVKAGSIRANLIRGKSAGGYRFIDVPFFTYDRKQRRKGMLRRQCTTSYKINPIRKKVREQLGLVPRQQVPKGYSVDMLIGLSSDEVTRMKPSPERWVEHRWPLIDVGMSRKDCMAWFKKKHPDRYLPRSACVICPFRSDSHWLEMREQDPDSYEQAVAFDRGIRKGVVRTRLEGAPYLHSSRKPLETAIAKIEREGASPVNHFENECEGMCGV